jgi:hypothetical protein
MLLPFLTDMHLDFGVEIVVILGIIAKDKKDFIAIMGVGLKRKCARFGYAKQLEFNGKVGKFVTIATFFSAYVQHRSPSFF